MSKSRQKLQSPQHDYCNFLQVQNYIDNLCFDKQMVLEILNRANPWAKGAILATGARGPEFKLFQI